jgi:tetratricopeptide (TPR) repeat protein
MKLQNLRLSLLATGLSLLIAAAPIPAEDHTYPTPPNQSVLVSVAGLRIPEKAWDHYIRAREATETHNEQQFDRETEAALKIEPNFAALYVLRATHKIHLGHLEAGLADALTARRIEPGVAWSGIALASAYNGLHRYQEAFLILSNTRAPESTTWQAAYETARASIGRGNPEDALYWSAVTLKLAPPACLETHILRGNSFLLAQRFAEAARELRLYLAAEGPQHPHPDIEQIARNLEHTTPDVASVSTETR